jgi:hypothetical protein
MEFVHYVGLLLVYPSPVQTKLVEDSTMDNAQKGINYK